MLANKRARFPEGAAGFLKKTRGDAPLTGSFDPGDSHQSFEPLRCELVELKETLQSRMEKTDSVLNEVIKALAASESQGAEVRDLTSKMAILMKRLTQMESFLEAEFVRKEETADLDLGRETLLQIQERDMISEEEREREGWAGISAFSDADGADVKELHEQMAAEIEKLKAELKEKKILLAGKEREEWRARGQSNKMWNGKLRSWIAKLISWIVNGKRYLAQLLGSAPNALFLRKAVTKDFMLANKRAKFPTGAASFLKKARE
jgi:hypothetical protein